MDTTPSAKREFEFPDGLLVDDSVDEWIAEHGISRTPKRPHGTTWARAAIVAVTLTGLAIYSGIMLR